MFLCNLSIFRQKSILFHRINTIIKNAVVLNRLIRVGNLINVDK